MGGNPLPPSLTRLDAVNNNFATPEKLRVFTNSLTASYGITDQLTIKNILAYRTFTDRLTNALDGAGGLIDPFGSGNPFLITSVPIYSREKQWTDELQLNYKSAAFDAVGGIFYYTQRYNYQAPLFALKSVPNFTPPVGLVSKSRAKTHNSSIAGFVQATAHLTSRFDLTGGIRRTEDKRITTAIDPTSAAVQAGTFRRKFSHTDWTVNAAYRASDGLMFYGRVATGYLSGGVVTSGIPFKPEEITQYEVGIKSEMLDRRLRVNVAGFYSDYKDLQALDFSQGFVRFTNAGKSRIRGLEVEVSARPFDRLTLNANAGYTDFKYLSYVIGGVDLTDTYRPLYFPKFTSSANADLTLATFGSGSKLSLNVGAEYRSQIRYAQPVNSPALNAATISPRRLMLDGRVMLDDVQLSGADCRISLWARNLTNQRKLAYVADLGTVVEGTFQEPRSFGIDLSANF